YAESWHQEAEQRGLSNLRTTVDALPWLVEKQTIETFERYDVLSERELESRFEVFVEQYSTKLNIEAETAASIARAMLLPAGGRRPPRGAPGGRPRGPRERDGGPGRRVRHGDPGARGEERAPPRRGGPRARALDARQHDPRRRGRPRGRRQARADRRRRPVAAAEVLGDAVPQVARETLPTAAQRALNL